MSSFPLSFEEIKELIAAVRENSFENFTLKQGEFELNITGCNNSKPTQFVETITETVDMPVINNDAAPLPLPGVVVASPIVGTFYEASAPDKPPYVQVGDRVHTGDILFIIESMKLMNEVVSEHSGIVREILVKNGEPVEYGQPILTIE